MDQGLNLRFPLDRFYEADNRPLPAISQVDGDAIPAPYRALLVGNHDMTPTAEESMIRELILQWKLGHVSPAYFQSKFGVDIQTRFKPAWDKMQNWGYLAENGEELRLNREGLLHADRLVHEFFLPEHRDKRYA